MNTYDPAERIRYVRMAPEGEPYATALEGDRRWTRLPAGYANRSPRTCLRGRPGQPVHGAA